MDKQNRFSEQIKASFEQSDKPKAPEDFWQGLSDALETEGLIGAEKTEFVENSEKFENSIKNSFTSNYQKTAPGSVWSKIQSTITSEDTAEDQIRDSFEQQYQKAAPEYIWNAVRHQINIDSVWSRLTVFLDRMQYRARWRQRLRRWASYATIVVFMHACLPIDWSQQEGPAQPKNSNLPIAMHQETPAATGNSVNQASVDPQKIPQQFTPLIEQLPSTQLNKKTRPLLQKEAPQPSVFGNRPNFNAQLQAQKLRLLGFPLANLQTEEVIPLSEELPLKPDPTEEEETAELPTRSSTVATTILATISTQELPEPEHNFQEPLAPITLQSKKSKKSSTEPRISLGLIAAHGMGTLLNQETFISLESNSTLALSSTHFSNLGLIFTTRLKPHASLSFQLSGWNHIRQGLTYYSPDGRFQTKLKELNYIRLAASYKRNLGHYRIAGLASSFLIKGGLYSAFLIEENIVQTSATASRPEFSSFDLGGQFALGQQHQWNQLLLEYGVQTNIGLANIFQGQTLGTNIAVNRTTLLNAAIYLSLRYTIP